MCIFKLNVIGSVVLAILVSIIIGTIDAYNDIPIFLPYFLILMGYWVCYITNRVGEETTPEKHTRLDLEEIQQGALRILREAMSKEEPIRYKTVAEYRKEIKFEKTFRLRFADFMAAKKLRLK